MEKGHYWDGVFFAFWDGFYRGCTIREKKTGINTAARRLYVTVDLEYCNHFGAEARGRRNPTPDYPHLRRSSSLEACHVKPIDTLEFAAQNRLQAIVEAKSFVRDLVSRFVRIA